MEIMHTGWSHMQEMFQRRPKSQQMTGAPMALPPHSSGHTLGYQKGWWTMEVTKLMFWLITYLLLLVVGLTIQQAWSETVDLMLEKERGSERVALHWGFSLAMVIVLVLVAIASARLQAGDLTESNAGSEQATQDFKLEAGHISSANPATGGGGKPHASNYHSSPSRPHLYQEVQYGMSRGPLAIADDLNQAMSRKRTIPITEDMPPPVPLPQSGPSTSGPPPQATSASHLSSSNNNNTASHPLVQSHFPFELPQTQTAHHVRSLNTTSTRLRLNPASSTALGVPPNTPAARATDVSRRTRQFGSASSVNSTPYVF